SASITGDRRNDAFLAVREAQHVVHPIGPLGLLAHRPDTASVQLKPVILSAFEYVPSDLSEVAQVLCSATAIAALGLAPLVTARTSTLLEELFLYITKVNTACLVRHLALTPTVAAWLGHADKDRTSLIPV